MTHKRGSQTAPISHQTFIQLLSLLAEAKSRNLWEDTFGRAAFMVQMIQTKVTDKDTGLATNRVFYIDVVQKHVSVQLSVGSANNDGLINFSMKFVLHRINEDGTQGPTIRKLVQSVMKYETLDGDNIWLAAIPRDEG